MTTKIELPLTVEAAKQFEGLNAGCGQWYADGWVNLELEDPHDNADIIASVFDMPIENGCFRKVYLGHVLEHIPFSMFPELGKEIRRVCKPGAQVMAVGPCIHRAIATSQPRHIIEAILSNPIELETSPPGIAHAWTPTEELTIEAMNRMGLENVYPLSVVGVTKPEYPNPSTALWQTAVAGTVPA